MKKISLVEFEALELLELYSDIIIELCERGIIRTVNNPAADYAEHLVAAALSLKPAPPSTKGYDAIDENGNKYEVKARRLTRRNKPTRFSAIRKLDEESFDYLAAVLFEEDFSINRAYVFPLAFVQQKAFWQAHVNGWILPISDNLWDSIEGNDITDKLQEVQKTGEHNHSLGS
jgi:hypothetical protein